MAIFIRKPAKKKKQEITGRIAPKRRKKGRRRGTRKGRKLGLGRRIGRIGGVLPTRKKQPAKAKLYGGRGLGTIGKIPTAARVRAPRRIATGARGLLGRAVGLGGQTAEIARREAGRLGRARRPRRPFGRRMLGRPTRYTRRRGVI